MSGERARSSAEGGGTLVGRVGSTLVSDRLLAGRCGTAAAGSVGGNGFALAGGQGAAEWGVAAAVQSGEEAGRGGGAAACDGTLAGQGELAAEGWRSNCGEAVS